MQREQAAEAQRQLDSQVAEAAQVNHLSEHPKTAICIKEEVFAYI